MAGLLTEYNRFEHRLQNFQTSIDPDEVKRKRDNYSISLRRQKRNNYTALKRFEYIDDMSETEINENYTGWIEPLLGKYPDLASESLKFIEKAEILKKILVDNEEDGIISLQVLWNLSKYEKFIFVFKNPAEEFLKAVLRYLDFQLGYESVLHSAWILCNLTAGPEEISETLVKLGAIDKLLNSLTITSDQLSEIIIWCLTHIMISDKEQKKVCIRKGIIDVMSEYIIGKHTNDKEINRVFVWCVETIVENLEFIPPPELQKIINLLKILTKDDDVEINWRVMGALGSITLRENSKIQLVIDNGFVPIAFKNLKSHDAEIVHKSLKLIGNICSGSASQTQLLLEENLMKYLCEFSRSTESSIRILVYWTIGNVSGGTRAQCDTFFENNEILQVSINGLNDPSSEVRRWASMIFTNALLQCSQHSKNKLMSFNIFDSIREALNDSDPEFLSNVLEIVSKLLESEDDGSKQAAATLFDFSGCLDALERVQKHENMTIFNLCQYIIETFFGVEEYSE